MSAKNMTKLVTVLAISFALAACGGKAKKATTPDNKSNDTQMKGDGSTGGASYGGATAPAGSGGGADPCGG
jgi:hypothetical protein